MSSNLIILKVRFLLCACHEFEPDHFQSSISLIRASWLSQVRFFLFSFSPFFFSEGFFFFPGSACEIVSRVRSFWKCMNQENMQKAADFRICNKSMLGGGEASVVSCAGRARANGGLLSTRACMRRGYWLRRVDGT